MLFGLLLLSFWAFACIFWLLVFEFLNVGVLSLVLLFCCCFGFFVVGFGWLVGF